MFARRSSTRVDDRKGEDPILTIYDTFYNYNGENKEQGNVKYGD